LAQNFIDLQTDGSGCPREDWLLEMAKDDALSNKLFINVGVNKGYNFAIWMNVFNPKTKVTPMRWYQELHKNHLTTEKLCGVCEDCKETFESNQLSVATHLTMLGIDLNCENLEGIQKALRGIYEQNDAEHVTTFTSCVGVSDHSGSMNMRLCPFGYETCALDRSYKYPTKEVTVPITTMTDLTEIFLSHIHQHYENPNDSPFSSTHLNPSSPSFDLMIHSHNLSHYFFATGKNYHPLIDILMIDTEGNDYLVIKGSTKLLQTRNIRVLIFEYHGFPPWNKLKLEDLKDELDGYGYDCYFQGIGRLWKITGKNCWSNLYEFHNWSNVMCVRRDDVWYHSLQRFVVQDVVKVHKNG
jgi:hypothetical protein